MYLLRHAVVMFPLYVYPQVRTYTVRTSNYLFLFSYILSCVMGLFFLAVSSFISILLSPVLWL